ncbi:hypothetical protein ACU4GD_01250 [Cupriavidus basilensis]
MRAGLKQPRQERSEATLKAMLAAGRTLINEAGSLSGFPSPISCAPLPPRSGPSMPGFPDKETFCALVLEDTLAELRAELDYSLATDPTWNAGPAAAICGRIVGFYVGLFRGHRGLFAAYMRHSPAQNPYWQPIREGQPADPGRHGAAPGQPCCRRALYRTRQRDPDRGCSLRSSALTSIVAACAQRPGPGRSAAGATAHGDAVLAIYPSPAAGDA